MEFDFTTPGTPQRNGLVEQKFATAFNQVCAMLNGRKFSSFRQKGSLAKANSTAVILKNNLITPNRDLTPFQQFLEKEKRSILASVQKFGEICITMYRDNSHGPKLAN